MSGARSRRKGKRGEHSLSHAKPTVAIGGVAVCQKHIARVGVIFKALAVKVRRS